MDVRVCVAFVLMYVRVALYRHGADYFGRLYRERNLEGAHVIKLGGALCAKVL